MSWVTYGKGSLDLGSAEKNSDRKCSCICRSCENYKLKQCKSIERKSNAVIQSG